MRKFLKEKIYSMLQDELLRRKRKLEENRRQIVLLSREQRALKKDWKEINDFLWEMKRAP